MGINRVRTSFALATLTVAMLSTPTHAEGWTYLIEPYVLFPNMQGGVGIGQLPVAGVDEDPQDIFDNLHLGAMLYAEARNDRWSIASDILYMDLEADIHGAGIIRGGEASAEQVGWELAVLGRLSPWIELGIAATYNKLKADVRLDLPNSSARGETSESWIDPSLVVRATIPMGDKWFLQGRGNIGGWGVGSDFFWQAQGHIGYRISDRFLMEAGYRVIGIDYDHGSGRDRFIYDMTTFGPQLKFGFTF